MRAHLKLISHALCPYVQRVAIVLKEKGVDFERVDIDLGNKPAWFLRLSPLGKTPVLQVDGGEALFESAVICEYLDETRSPHLHAADALVRARERAWMEFGSAVLSGIAALYNAATDDALDAARVALRLRFEQVEAALAKRSPGPWFSGERFGLVDAVFGPVFRYFDVIPPEGLFDNLPRVDAWRTALAERPSVRDAVAAGYAARLHAFLIERGSALSRRLATMAA